MSFISIILKIVFNRILAPADTPAAALKFLKSRKFKDLKKLKVFIDTYFPKMRYDLEIEVERILNEIILNMSGNIQVFVNYVSVSKNHELHEIMKKTKNRNHETLKELARRLRSQRNRRKEAKIKIKLKWNQNELDIILQLAFNLTELQTIRKIAMIYKWEETKERLPLTILNRLFSLNYSSDLLCKPTTTDWRNVCENNYEIGPPDDQELQTLGVHVNREGFLARPVCVDQKRQSAEDEREKKNIAKDKRNDWSKVISQRKKRNPRPPIWSRWRKRKRSRWWQRGWQSWVIYLLIRSIRHSSAPKSQL